MKIGRIVGQLDEHFFKQGKRLAGVAQFLVAEAVTQAGVEAGQPLVLLLVDHFKSPGGIVQGSRSFAAHRLISQRSFVLHPCASQPSLDLPAVEVVTGLVALDVVAALENHAFQLGFSGAIGPSPDCIRLGEVIAGRIH